MPTSLMRRRAIWICSALWLSLNARVTDAQAGKQVGGTSQSSADSARLPDPDRWLEVHFVDVGQGDGIWIRTPDDRIPGNGIYEGKNIVIDGGPNRSDAKNAMYRYLKGKMPEGTTIDAMIISHPHDDHYPGAWGLLSHFQVRDFYDSGYPKTGSGWTQFMAAARGAGVGRSPVSLHVGRDALGTPDWGAELSAEFLYAYHDTIGLGRGNTRENNASIVLKLTYGNFSFLFMGDAEGKDRNGSADTSKYVEAILLQHPEKLKATVLKVGHHGSETSSTVPFISAVDPDYVVVMSGRKSFNGRYLPDVSTLARYCAHKPTTVILRTDQDDEAERRTTANDADGDHVVFRTNGSVLLVEAYSNGKRIEAMRRCGDAAMRRGAGL